MNTKPFLIALAASFFLAVLGSITGALISSRHKDITGRFSPKWTFGVKVFYLLLFGVMAFSLVPPALHYFLSVQIWMGNGDSVLIRWLAVHEQQVIFGVWGLFAAGMGMAIPAAIRDGFFKYKGQGR